MKPLNDGRLHVAAPQQLCKAVARQAAARMEGVNTYVRQALLEALRKDGVNLEKDAA